MLPHLVLFALAGAAGGAEFAGGALVPCAINAVPAKTNVVMSFFISFILPFTSLLRVTVEHFGVVPLRRSHNVKMHSDDLGVRSPRQKTPRNREHLYDHTFIRGRI